MTLGPTAAPGRGERIGRGSLDGPQSQELEGCLGESLGLLREPCIDGTGGGGEGAGFDPALRGGAGRGERFLVFEGVFPRPRKDAMLVLLLGLLLLIPGAAEAGVAGEGAGGLAVAAFGVSLRGADAGEHLPAGGLEAGGEVTAGAEDHQGGAHGPVLRGLGTWTSATTTSSGPVPFVPVVIRPTAAESLKHFAAFCSGDVNLTESARQAQSPIFRNRGGQR